MKKTSSKIREEISKLQDVLKAAETREAERIGRVALKAGLGEIEIEDSAYAGIVATGLAQSYIAEVLKTARREPFLRALEARILELTAANATNDNPA